MANKYGKQTFYFTEAHAADYLLRQVREGNDEALGELHATAAVLLHNGVALPDNLRVWLSELHSTAASRMETLPSVRAAQLRKVIGYCLHLEIAIRGTKEIAAATEWAARLESNGHRKANGTAWTSRALLNWYYEYRDSHREPA